MFFDAMPFVSLVPFSAIMIQDKFGGHKLHVFRTWRRDRFGDTETERRDDWRIISSSCLARMDCNTNIRYFM